MSTTSAPPLRGAVLRDDDEPFAIAHCASCHVTRNLRGSDPLTGDLIREFRDEHSADAGHRVTLRLF
ncbi:MAG TPA: hypothetical protein VHE83_06085 [Mycobacteriales bacterium]|nr:hypothetical protein [Mycobacteriales bacterium]